MTRRDNFSVNMVNAWCDIKIERKKIVKNEEKKNVQMRKKKLKMIKM